MPEAPDFTHIAIYDHALVTAHFMLPSETPWVDCFPLWCGHVQKNGADTVYVRVKEPRTQELKKAVDCCQEVEVQCILPVGFYDASLEPEAWHFQSGAPAHPVQYALRGRSCHNVADVAKAHEEGFNYVFLSPIFPTLSHPEAKPVGLAALKKAAQLGIAVYALGGITDENWEGCVLKGAWGTAAIRRFLR